MIRHITLWITASLLLISQYAHAGDKELAPQLQVFAPYLGTWQSTFDTPAGKPPVVDVSMWERHLNGNAIRTLHSINDGEYGGESIIFFDKNRNSLVFYYFTTAEFFTTGTIEMVSDTSFVAYEDVEGNADGITKVKSVSEMSSEKMTVSTSYLKKGKWTEPERRVYTRSSKSVIFK
ncbi:hypothetical protein [Thalassotalea fusca]